MHMPGTEAPTAPWTLNSYSHNHNNHNKHDADADDDDDDRDVADGGSNVLSKPQATGASLNMTAMAASTKLQMYSSSET